MHHVAPGIGPVLGVRQPLLHAVSRRPARRDPPRPHRRALLDVAGHLVREPPLELHWLAFGLLERTIAERPGAHLAARAGGGPDGRELDHAWTPLRTSRRAGSSPSRTAGRSWSSSSTRRRAGSAASPAPPSPPSRTRTGPPAAPPRSPAAASRIVGDLIGDPEPDVQKALSWALRSLAVVDLPATAAFLRAEARTAARHRRRLPRVGHPRHAARSCPRRSPRS